jgi:hypothetical protein
MRAPTGWSEMRLRSDAVEPFAVEGKAEPVTAYGLIEVEPQGPTARRSDVTPAGHPVSCA